MHPRAQLDIRARVSNNLKGRGPDLVCELLYLFRNILTGVGLGKIVEIQSNATKDPVLVDEVRSVASNFAWCRSNNLIALEASGALESPACRIRRLSKNF